MSKAQSAGKPVIASAVSEQSRKLKELKNELNQIKQGGATGPISSLNQSMDSSKCNLSTTAGNNNETTFHIKSKRNRVA